MVARRPTADGGIAATLAWEQFGCEFVSLGNYGAYDPDAFYSMTFHRYKFGDRDAGTWDYTGCVAPFGQRRFYSDVHGVPRVLKYHDHPFYFLPSGDGVQVYRIEEEQMHLAALLGGRGPAPDGRREAKQLGQWTWHDADGTGEPKPEEINWFKKPGEGKYSCFGMDVDAGGNVVFADTSTHGIREVPVGPPDARGNPTYDWKDAKEVIAQDASPLKFEPNMAQRADDGSVYAFGWSARWPQPKNNPFWMGGTTLARFDKSGKLLWAVGLPKLCVGLDVIPTAAGRAAGASPESATAPGCCTTPPTDCWPARWSRARRCGSRRAGWTTTPRWPSTATRATTWWTCSPRTITRCGSRGTASTTGRCGRRKVR